jgi:uncharacterized protein YndB with AHSA1/START domain
MLKTILVVLAVAIATVLGLALTQPDTFQVQRSVRIKAPPERIFEQLQDFHRWSAWSPWEKLDPALQRTFTGPDAGKGATYAWQGNDKVGAGRMEVTDTTAPTRVLIQLDFIKPFEGHNITEFTLKPQADGTDLKWVMSGPSPFISKVMQVFVSMDKMIGKDFEAGLANLKAVAER